MAINQIDKELNDRLMSYANTLARGDRALEQTLKQQAKSLGAVQQDVVAEYEEYLSKSRTWHGKEAEEAKARLIRLRKLERDAESAQQEGVEAKIKHNRLLKQIEAEQASLMAGSASLSKSEVARRLAALSQQKNAAIQSFKEDSNSRTARYRLGMQAASERRAFENKELGMNAKWGNAFRSSLSAVGQAALTKAFGSLSVGAGVEKIADSIYTAVKEGSKHGTGLSVNPFDDSAIGIFGAAKHGFNTKEWMDVLNSPDTQRAIRSSQDGMYAFKDGLDLMDQTMSSTMIDAKERSQVAIKNMELMSSSGIRMQKTDAIAFSNSMMRAKETVGMAPEEFQKAMGEITQSEEVRTQLKMATSEVERRSIMDGIAAQLAQNRAMGMTTTEAIAAAKALGKLAGEKPLERFKKAAKLRAYGAAMGMGAEGNRLADLTMKKKRTADEEAEYRRLGSAMSEQYTQAGADGNVSAEIFATQLADKLGLEQMLGPNSPFNDTLAKSSGQLENAGNTISKVPAELSKVFAEAQQMFSSLTNNDLISGITMGVGGAFAMKNAPSIISNLFGIGSGSAGGANIISRIFPGLTGVGGTAATGVGGTAATGVGGTAATGVGTMASTLALAAAPLLAMYGVTKWTEDQSHDKERVDGLLTVSNALKTILPEWMGDPSKSAREKRESQLNELSGGPGSEYATIATAASEIAVQTAVDQAKQMDKNNATLDQLLTASQRQLEISEQQLMAFTNAESNQSTSEKKANLRTDSRFGSSYGYA